MIDPHTVHLIPQRYYKIILLHRWQSCINFLTKQEYGHFFFFFILLQDGITFRQQDSRQRQSFTAVKNTTGNVGVTQHRVLSGNHYFGEKEMSVTYSECVCVCLRVLIIRQAKHIRRPTLPSVACPALPYLSTLYNIRHNLTNIYIYIYSYKA
jgi:hypothetical protein